MATYRLLDYDNSNVQLEATAITVVDVRPGETIISSGTAYNVRRIEHDPANTRTNLYLTQKNSFG